MRTELVAAEVGVLLRQLFDIGLPLNVSWQDIAVRAQCVGWLEYSCSLQGLRMYSVQSS